MAKSFPLSPKTIIKLTIIHQSEHGGGHTHGCDGPGNYPQFTYITDQNGAILIHDSNAIMTEDSQI